MTAKPDACEFCGDVDGAFFLAPRCHPSAPLRAVKLGDVLILRCYVPTCDREVVRFTIAAPELADEDTEEHEGFLG